MLWLSADIAEVTGLALWRGPDLVRTARLAKVGKHGPRYSLGDVVYEDELRAWLAAFRASAPLDDRPELLVAEDVHVARRGQTLLVQPAISLARRHGRVDAWWQASAPERRAVVLVEVATWREVVRQTVSLGAFGPGGWAWPKKGEDCKPVAQALVREHYGRDVTADEADAVMVGHWFVRTGGLR